MLLFMFRIDEIAIERAKPFFAAVERGDLEAMKGMFAAQEAFLMDSVIEKGLEQAKDKAVIEYLSPYRSAKSPQLYSAFSHVRDIGEGRASGLAHLAPMLKEMAAAEQAEIAFGAFIMWPISCLKLCSLDLQRTQVMVELIPILDLAAINVLVFKIRRWTGVSNGHPFMEELAKLRPDLVLTEHPVPREGDSSQVRGMALTSPEGDAPPIVYGASLSLEEE